MTIDDSPFPPVANVHPGLWSVPVPIPTSPLRYVLVYVFETERGPYLLDAGWNTDAAYQALTAGLVSIGTNIEEVQGVMVTHIHADHYGLAGRIRQVSGAWVGLHPADAALIQDRYEDPEDLIERTEAMLRRDGTPPEEIEAITNASMPIRSWVSTVFPDVLIEDGQRPEVPEWDLRAVWTPGHSPGHLCIYEASNRLLFSGDHVLPRISPAVSFHPQSSKDPLGDFLDSLYKVLALDPVAVHPAHEHPFSDLRSRVEQLTQHHTTRLDEVRSLLRAGSTTTWDIASQMTWSRPWDQIQGWMRRAAAGEARAHLNYLRVRGELDEVPGEPSRWRMTDISS